MNDPWLIYVVGPARRRGAAGGVAMRGWSIADAPHGALARVNWLLRSSVSNEAAATVMRYAWGFPEKTIAGLLGTRARREDAMYHEPSSMTEADRTLEALRLFAIDSGALVDWLLSIALLRAPGTDFWPLELQEARGRMSAAMMALGGGEPKPEPARADASVLDRATAAVRDEAGSRLCAWVDETGRVNAPNGTKRVCRTEVVGRAGVCLCRQVALAVIDVLEPREA